jgi:hypothetical protein
LYSTLEHSKKRMTNISTYLQVASALQNWQEPRLNASRSNEPAKWHADYGMTAANRTGKSLLRLKCSIRWSYIKRCTVTSIYPGPFLVLRWVDTRLQRSQVSTTWDQWDGVKQIRYARCNRSEIAQETSVRILVIMTTLLCGVSASFLSFMHSCADNIPMTELLHHRCLLHSSKPM